MKSNDNADSSAGNSTNRNDLPAKTESASGGERLQKLMARAGIASRRAAETLIADGKVSVNGQVVRELGVKADPTRDKILVNGKPLHLSDEAPTVVLLHKPRGFVTTKSDPQGRDTVLNLLPRKLQHLNPVGRLDFDTSGVLLLTDDGDLLHLLTHPSHGVEKVYHARVGGKVLPDTVKKLEAGVYILEDEKHIKTSPCRVRVIAQTENNALVEVSLREGRNRQVRKMLDAVGHRVSSLRRVSFAALELEELGSGAYRVLLPGEVHALRKTTEKGLQKQSRSKPPRKPRMGGKPASTRPSGPADRQTPEKRSSRAATERPAAERPGASRRSPRSALPNAGRTAAGENSAARKSGTAPTDTGAKTDSSRGARDRPAAKKSSSRKPLPPLGERIRREWK